MIINGAGDDFIAEKAANMNVASNDGGRVAFDRGF